MRFWDVKIVVKELVKKKPAKVKGKEVPGEVKKTKPEKVHPLLQGTEHGWPSNPLRRGSRKSWINEW